MSKLPENTAEMRNDSLVLNLHCLEKLICTCVRHTLPLRMPVGSPIAPGDQRLALASFALSRS